MEDFQLDIVIGKGPAARSIRLDLPRFTLVGATTRTGLITGPLRDRFGFVARLDYYDTDDLVADPRARRRASSACRSSTEGAQRDRAAARGARRGSPTGLLKRVRDYAEVRGRRHRHHRDRARRARAVRGRRARPRQGRPRRSSPRCARRSAASRSGSTPSRWRWPRSPRRSRRSTSRSCSRRACCSARPAVAIATPGALRAPAPAGSPRSCPSLFADRTTRAAPECAAPAAAGSGRDRPLASATGPRPSAASRQRQELRTTAMVIFVYFAVIAAGVLPVDRPAAAPARHRPPGAARVARGRRRGHHHRRDLRHHPRARRRDDPARGRRRRRRHRGPQRDRAGGGRRPGGLDGDPEQRREVDD